jgi:RimJ/RimL family protein N-acetyltransferase
LLTAPILASGTISRNEQPAIEARNGLILRPWQDDDAPFISEGFACPDIQRWHVRRMDTEAESRGWIASWRKSWAAETAASWAIVDDGKVAGQVGLRSVLLFEGTASLSYWILPGARGKGIAGHAVQALTQWAFETAGFHRLALHHSTLNQQSCRVASKAGYEFEGVLRSAAPHADGWHDMHVHARVS